MKSLCLAPRAGRPRFCVLAPGLAVHSACRPARRRGEQRGASRALPPAPWPPCCLHGLAPDFSAPLSPRFSLERKHPAVAQALVTVQRGDTTCPFSKTCDFTARAGPRGGRLGAGRCSLLGHLAGAAPPPRKEPWAQQLSGTASGQRRPPLPGEKGSGGARLSAAPGSCTRRDSAGGPGGPCLTPRSTAHSRAGGGVPGTHRAHGSLTFGRAGPQPAHPQEDSRDRAGAGGRGASGAGGQGGAVGGVGGGAGPGPCS